jgi:hypothetical protein|eukprot:COSAG01_NODE_1622_length_9712_cov_40.535005_4_plen_160_part_00
MHPRLTAEDQVCGVRRYNPNLEDAKRMTLPQFIRATRTPDTEKDPGCSEEACKGIFDRIKAKEIKLQAGGMGEDGLILRPTMASHGLPEDRAGHVVIKSLYQDDTNMVGYVDTPSLAVAIHSGCMLGLDFPTASCDSGASCCDPAISLPFLSIVCRTLG